MSCEFPLEFVSSTSLKNITKLYLEHSGKFEIKIKKIPVVVYVFQTPHNLVISRCCHAEDDKEMYLEL